MPWTTETFREKQSLLRLSNVKLAVALGVGTNYVEHMRAGRRPVSGPTESKMTKLMEDRGINPTLTFL